MKTLLQRASNPDITEVERRLLLNEVAERMKKGETGLDKVLDKLLGTTLTEEASSE